METITSTSSVLRKTPLGEPVAVVESLSTSYFEHKVTVAMVTVRWLVFASLVIYFSFLSPHICNISVWRPLMSAVDLALLQPPTVFHFSFLTFSSFSESLNEKSACKESWGEMMCPWSQSMDDTERLLQYQSLFMECCIVQGEWGLFADGLLIQIHELWPISPILLQVSSCLAEDVRPSVSQTGSNYITK